MPKFDLRAVPHDFRPARKRETLWNKHVAVEVLPDAMIVAAMKLQCLAVPLQELLIVVLVYIAPVSPGQNILRLNTSLFLILPDTFQNIGLFFGHRNMEHACPSYGPSSSHPWYKEAP